MTSFGFTRSVRTSSSEVYYIFLEDTRVGTLNAHYTKIVHANLFLEVDLSDSMREELFDSIYRILDVIELEDIYFSVNRGVHETIFSNTVDHSQLPPTRGDIQKLHKEISSHAGKHKRVVSHLNEQVAQEYFEIKGYDVVKATSEQDHSKIDLIALNESRVLPIQVKSGEIPNKEIKKCIEKMISEVTIQKHARDGKVIIATFVARSYQENVNLLRIELEDAYSCKVLLITHSDIFAVLPKYRHALGG